MPDDVRGAMEQSFGVDFSAVRIHEGPQARDLGAHAFTQGTDVHFATGRYQPDSPAGRELLGHELGHVVQQAEGRVDGTTQAKGVVVNDDSALEREADERGAAAARGERVAAGAPATVRPAALAGRGSHPAQRKEEAAPTEHGGAPDVPVPEHGDYPLETDGGVYPTDGILLGAASGALRQRPRRDPANPYEGIVADVPRGAIVQVYGKRGGWKFVLWSGQQGFVSGELIEDLSPRFSRVPELMACMTGGNLEPGDSGTAVSVLQQALAEMGGLQTSDINGSYDAATESAVRAFQRAEGISPLGFVGPQTMSALNRTFASHGVEAAQLAATNPPGRPTEGVNYDRSNTPPELLADTRNISSDEQAAVEDAINIEPTTASGAAPTFVPVVEGVGYATRLREALDSIIPSMYERMAEGRQAQRADPDNLHDWGDIEDVAVQSKNVTDEQFGDYALGPALSATPGPDQRIFDAWEEKEDDLAADPSIADDWVEWRVRKILTSHPRIEAIDEMHGAIQSRATERAIVTPIKAAAMTTYRTELIEIHKAWPAFANDDGVFIQRFQERNDDGSVDNEAGRDYMWDIFQTIIHEYIHTLEHREHVTHRESMSDVEGGFVLREGITDYFTKIVYQTTDTSDAALRRSVEGPFHEPGVVHPVAPLHTYGQSREAEQVAGIIGFANLAAAFFLGRTELYEHS